MKKILVFLFFLFLLSFVSVWALPTDLELNVTFDYFSLSPDGVTYSTIIGSPFTINLLSSAVVSTTGTAVTITPPAAGTYKFLKMGVSAIYFKQGATTRDILPILKAQSGGQEDWDAMVMSLLPFTYTSGDLGLNMYMPASNISGSSIDDYFPENGPVFNFTGGSVANSAVGTANVTISSGVDAGTSVFLAAFQSFQQQSAPSFNASITNNGDGSASGTMKLPPGSWYLMAMAQAGSMGVDGPAEGSKGYTVGGAEPWAGSISPTTIATGEITAVTLSYAFTVTASMGAGGSPKAPKGTGSIAFTLTSTPGATTVGSDAQLMLYAFSSVASFEAGGPPAYFLGAKNVDAGSFSTTTMTASELAAGNYVVVAMLDVDGNGQPSEGDIFGMYGALGSPTVIALTEGQALDHTASPIYLSDYSGE